GFPGASPGLAAASPGLPAPSAGLPDASPALPAPSAGLPDAPPPLAALSPGLAVAGGAAFGGGGAGLGRGGHSVTEDFGSSPAPSCANAAPATKSDSAMTTTWRTP